MSVVQSINEKSSCKEIIETIDRQINGSLLKVRMAIIVFDLSLKDARDLLEL